LVPLLPFYTSAHEVHDLYSIIGLKPGRRPIQAPHYTLIQLDSNSFWSKLQRGDQVR